MAETSDTPQIPSVKRRRRWKRWVLLVSGIVGLVVLDGPGWRWLAGWSTEYFLPKFGLKGGAKFEGRLSDGSLRVEDLRLSGEGAIQSVKLDRLEIRYAPSRVVRGELTGVEVKGLEAELDLSRPWPSAGGSEPTKTEEVKVSLAEQLRRVREKFLPVAADLQGMKLRVRRGEELVYELASSGIRHESGQDSVRLMLGEMTFPKDQKLPAQESVLAWREKGFSLDVLKLAPGLGVESLRAELGENDSVAYALRLRFQEALLEAEGDLEKAKARLVEGSVAASAVGGLLGQELPAEAVLEMLEVEASGFSKGLPDLRAGVRMGLRGVKYQDWTAEALRLDADLNGQEAKADLEAEAMGARISLKTRTGLDRSKGIVPRQTEAEWLIPEVKDLLTRMRERMRDLKPLGDVPEAALQGRAVVEYQAGKPRHVAAELQVTPKGGEQVSGLKVNADWRVDAPLEAQVRLDGLQVGSKLDLQSKRYEGDARFDGFTPDRLSVWLAAFGVAVPPEMVLRGTWQGSGDFGPEAHSGTLAITKFDWKQARGGPVEVKGAVDYAWPKRVAVDGLTAAQGGQKIACDALLENQLLALKNLRWDEGDAVLFEGVAEVPVPENPGDVKALLRQNRPISVKLASRELPLTRLHPFLAEDVRFPESARGRVKLIISGTPAKPQVEGEILGRDLGMKSKDSMPKADLDLRFRSEEEELRVEGTLITPGYPAANLAARLPFRPGEWSEHPEVLKSESLEASLKVPNLELARFAALVPKLKTLSGALKVDLVVGGTLGEPKPMGEVELKDGVISPNDESFAPLEKIAIRASATPEGVELRGLTLAMSGGTLEGRGKLKLNQWKPAEVDFTVRGRSLPLKRDESVIVRANLDLALRGPWDTARLTGTVGVVDSLFYRDIELLPIGVPFNQPSSPELPALDVAKRDQAAAALPDPFQNWSLGVKVKTENAFLIRGNLADGFVTMDVDVGGTFGKPAPKGKALLHRVSAKLPFSTLLIEEGEVNFRPEAPFDPALNIRGRSTVRPYEVNLYVYGNVSDPKVLTTSNPPLPESEIMTLLATGTTTKGIEDPQAALSRAAQLLVEELRRGRIRNSRRLQPVLKLLDRVDFQIGQENPYSGQKMNAANIQLDDNWVLSAGVGDLGNSRAMLMYLIRFR